MGAPFSEPREWEPCPECEKPPWRRSQDAPQAPEDPFAGCPLCGQPPRCDWGRGTGEHCPRSATTVLMGRPFVCGQHWRWQALAHEREEWELAGEYLGHFRGLARSLCNDALLEALDLAHAECEMRAFGAEQERRMIWEGD